MRRIEIAPVDSPILECCDHGVGCFIHAFEGNSLPKGWSGLKRIFVIVCNVILLGLCYASDWLFYTRWPRLPNLLANANGNHPLGGHGANDTGTPAKPGNTRRQREIFEIIQSIYLCCLIASALLFVSMQCFIYLFALWRKTWRQTLVLVVEMVALVVQACAPPILVCFLFFMTEAGSAGQDIPSISGVCGWQMLALAVTHGLYLLVLECAKLAYLGLCCCSCFTCCLFLWPVYKAFQIVFGDSSKDVEYQSTASRHRTFGATVLDFMPPQTDRGSWFTAAKWCAITTWTFPVTLAGLLSCAILIAIVIMDRNFIYYDQIQK